MTVHRSLFILLTTLVITGCEDRLTKEAKATVAASLRDPGSAEFRNLSRCGRSAIVAGEVNSKNGFGGYTGFSHFTYADGQAGIMGTGDDAFTVLTRLCSRAIEAETAEITRAS